MNQIVRYLPVSIWLLSLLIVLISLIKDRRRFRISFYVLFHFFALFYFLISHYQGTKTGALLTTGFALFWIWMILIVPFLLIINGFDVIRKEGLSLPNVLSLGFGILIFTGIFSCFKGLQAYLSGVANPYVTLFWLAFGTMMFYISIIFVAFLFYSLLRHVIPKKTTYDFVLVLGAGLINGEKVTPLLASRCNKAMKVYNRSFSACKIICSGGQGKDEKISEAQAMKNYMVENGIDPGDIILEDQSATTKENIVNCKKILEKKKGRKFIALVTSDFHVLRAIIYAKEIQLPCIGIGSRTAFYYWPTAMIREFIALMKYYLPWFSGGLFILWFLEVILIKFF